MAENNVLSEPLKEENTAEISGLGKFFRRPRKNKRRMVFAALVSLLVFIILLALCAAYIVKIYSSDVTVEVGEIPDFSHITENRFANTVCKITTDLSSVDTSEPGNKDIMLRFFGFIDFSSTLIVNDTIPPEITVKNIFIASYIPIEAEMFISSSSDRTDLAFEFESTDDFESIGKHTVTIRARDEGGNETIAVSSLTVADTGEAFIFEYGTSTDDIEKRISAAFPESGVLDTSAVAECGNFTVYGEDDDTFYYFGITVKDSVSPKATVHSFDIVLGQTLSEKNLISDISDHSEVTVNYTSLPDFKTAGEHTVTVTLTDSYGNTTEYTSYIRIHDINTEITSEIYSSNSTLSRLIFNDAWSAEKLSFENSYVSQLLFLGNNSVSLIGEYGTVYVKVNIVDTTAPVLNLKTVEVLTGTEISPQDFVESCSDATKVSCAFFKKPSTAAEGTYTVTVTATDIAGNSSTASSTLVVFADRTPPVLYGVADISCRIGAEPPYFDNVYAEDNSGGFVDISADISAADTSKAGVYPITYIAVDEYGNTATKTVSLTVKEATYVCLDVQNILQKPALPNGCEVVSLAIALNYSGCYADPLWLFENYMPHAEYNSLADPWITYIGDPTGKGLGCYSPCVVTTGNAYLTYIGSSLRVKNVSSQNLSYYESCIDRSVPVIMWGTVNMNGNSKIYRSWYSNGRTVVWHNYSHCLVMIGYTDDTYIFCDPLCGITEYDKSAVEKSFDINFRQACIIE